jgi:hypothetical protein
MGGFGTRPYVCLYGITEVGKHSCDGGVVCGVDEDVDVAEGA